MSRGVTDSDVVAVGGRATALALAPSVSATARVPVAAAIAIDVVTLSDGRTHLINSDTREQLGIAATPEVGRRTRQFFAR